MSTRIFDGFSVETGGEQSLRIMKWEDLIRKVPRSLVKGDRIDLGFGFTKDMADRFGGKKLKLYKVMRRCHENNGTNFRLVFSFDDTDTFPWNEYMTVEFWENGGRVRDTNPPEQRREPVASPTPTKAPAKKSGNKLLKMFLLMNLLGK